MSRLTAMIAILLQVTALMAAPPAFAGDKLTACETFLSKANAKWRPIVENAVAVAVSTGLALWPYAALAGPGNGGGGDSRVAAFLNAAEAACVWMEGIPSLSSKTEACRAELADLLASVNDPKRVARLYSDSKPALDNGVPKDAVTDLKKRRIHINISRWEASSYLGHKVTALMEMTLLLGIPDRYNLGKQLTSELAASIAHGGAADFKIFQEWARKYIESFPLKSKTKSKYGLKGFPFIAIQGETEDHVPCYLFVTDKYYTDDIQDVYLSLGVGHDLKPGRSVLDVNNYYIGGGVSNNRPDLQMNPHEIHFRSIDYETVGEKPDGSPIAEFCDNRLLIELSNSGQVFRVTGTSSRFKQPVICKMKM